MSVLPWILSGSAKDRIKDSTDDGVIIPLSENNSIKFKSLTIIAKWFNHINENVLKNFIKSEKIECKSAYFQY
ncbi:hypothetical protein GCM10007941_22460 [Amphritea balenae]|nr:hypothetical protein GCM10007941_22460 [Amphritea balenae]